MTFTGLQERIGKQDPADWRQHPNGGGWHTPQDYEDRIARLQKELEATHRFRAADDMIKAHNWEWYDISGSIGFVGTEEELEARKLKAAK